MTSRIQPGTGVERRSFAGVVRSHDQSRTGFFGEFGKIAIHPLCLLVGSHSVCGRFGPIV